MTHKLSNDKYFSPFGGDITEFWLVIRRENIAIIYLFLKL